MSLCNVWPFTHYGNSNLRRILKTEHSQYRILTTNRVTKQIKYLSHAELNSNLHWF